MVAPGNVIFISYTTALDNAISNQKILIFSYLSINPCHAEQELSEDNAACQKGLIGEENNL